MNRNATIDFIKGVAILSIILYHFGFLPLGYLGVDVFLVVSGFLIIPKAIKIVSTGDFNPLTFLWKRISRFIPALLTISCIGLLIGWFAMLPDDYENLSESVFASNIFANNILQSITVKNYWNPVNEFKPLLTTWYLGIIVQMFVVISIVFFIISLLTKCLKIRDVSAYRISIGALIILTVSSLALFIFSNTAYSLKYYMPWFRIWEFLGGGILGTLRPARITRHSAMFYVFLSILLLILLKDKLFPEMNIGNGNIYHIYIVASSLLLLNFQAPLKSGNVFAKIGEMSLSLFLWHQFVIAFYRYIFNFEINLLILILLGASIICISFLSYKFIEPIKLTSSKLIIIASVIWVCVLSVSYWIYSRAGVVRDVPELKLSFDNPLTMRNTEYIDRFYGYNHAFDESKIKVLVIGNSFARDFASCLEEWDEEGAIDIVYLDRLKPEDPRLSECQYIFFYGFRDELEPAIKNINPSSKIYGIGTKFYGKSLGPIYSRRFKEDYYNQTLRLPDEIVKFNDNLRASWGEKNYIDYIRLSSDSANNIRVFTPDSLLISFDGLHLTKWGAKYYSQQIGFGSIFSEDGRIGD